MTKITVIDVETSDLDPDRARVIELAALTVETDPPLLPTLGPVVSWLFRPGEGLTVAPTASAVHHLTDADLVGKLVFDQAAWVRAAPDADLNAAHYAAFDRTHVERVCSPTMVSCGPRWLCTWKLALAAWPEAPSHSNQALRYWLGLTGPLPAGLAPHRAGYDATVTAWLLVRLLEHYSSDLDKMIAISANPALLARIGFGKHRGRPWSEAPPDYLRWVLSQNFDENVRHTARHWLERGR